jgi:hypothetical protein
VEDRKPDEPGRPRPAGDPDETILDRLARSSPDEAGDILGAGPNCDPPEADPDHPRGGQSPSPGRGPEGR